MQGVCEYKPAYKAEKGVYLCETETERDRQRERSFIKMKYLLEFKWLFLCFLVIINMTEDDC